MRNRLYLGILGGLSCGLVGCAASAVEQEVERDADVDFVAGEPDASGTDADDDGDDVSGRIDAGRMRDSGRPDAGAGDGGAADGGQASGDGGPRLDSGARDAGSPDASPPAKPDASVPDAAQPVADAGGPGCQSGTQMCGSQCVDTKTSNQNCGACGTVCNNGASCSDSKCAAPITVPAGCAAKLFESRTYVFCTNGRNWKDARRVCIDAKMDLALVTSNGEGDFIKGNGDSWIAGNDFDREGTWLSPVLGNAGNNNGPALSFTRWNRGEPSNTQRCDGLDIFVSCLGRRSDEDCAMVRGADGLWNDDDCDRNHNFVCEPL